MNPIKTILGLLSLAHDEVKAPEMIFVTLLTAASVSGKILGMTTEEIIQKLREVDNSAEVIHKDVVEKL